MGLRATSTTWLFGPEGGGDGLSEEMEQREEECKATVPAGGGIVVESEERE